MIYYIDVPATTAPAAALLSTGLPGTSRGVLGTARLQDPALLSASAPLRCTSPLAFTKG